MRTVIQTPIEASEVDSIKKGELILYCILFLFLPPIVGLPLIIYQIAAKRDATKTDYYKFFCCMALYFACINATKRPAGDQITYAWAYYNVPKLGLWGSMANIYGYDIAKGLETASVNLSGEFMNGIFNYIGYYLTFGYYPLYAAIITFVDFILIYLAFYKLLKSDLAPHIPIICSVLILSFFYIYFQFSLQIQKQFLAQSIMMYALGCYAERGGIHKKTAIFIIMAVFTHASTALFLPFFLYKPLRGKMSRNTLIVFGMMLMIIIYLGPSLAGAISVEKTALTYGIDRLARSESNNDGGSIPVIQIIAVLIPMALVVYRKLLKESEETLSESIYFVLNIVLLLILTIVAMQKQPTAQYRYFMMLYVFFPFLMTYVFNDIHKRNKFLLNLSVFMIIWFYYQFERITWHYAPEIDIIAISPVFLLAK